MLRHHSGTPHKGIRLTSMAVAVFTMLSCAFGGAGTAVAGEASTAQMASTSITQPAEQNTATETGDAAANGNTPGTQSDEPSSDGNQSGAQEGEPSQDANQPGAQEGEPSQDANQPGAQESETPADGNQPGAEDGKPSASADMSVTTPGVTGAQGNVELNAASAGDDLPDLIWINSDIFLNVSVVPEGISLEEMVNVAKTTIPGAKGVQFELTPLKSSATGRMSPMPEGCQEQEGESCIATQTGGRSVYFGTDQGFYLPRVYFPMNHNREDDSWTYEYELRMIHPEVKRDSTGMTPEEKKGVFFGREVFHLSYTVTIDEHDSWIVQTESEEIVNRYGCEGSNCNIPGVTQTTKAATLRSRAAMLQSDREIIDGGGSEGLNKTFTTSSYANVTFNAHKAFAGIPPESDRYGVLLEAFGNTKDKDAPTLDTATPMPGRQYQPTGSDLSEDWFGPKKYVAPFTVAQGSSTGTAKISISYLSVDVSKRGSAAKGESRWFSYKLCEVDGTGTDAECVTQADSDREGIQYDLSQYELWIRGTLTEDKGLIVIDHQQSYVLKTQNSDGLKVSEEYTLDGFKPTFSNKAPGTFSFTKQGANGQKLAEAKFTVTPTNGENQPLWFTKTGDGAFRYCPTDEVKQGDSGSHYCETAPSGEGASQQPAYDYIVTGSEGSATVTGINLTDFLPKDGNGYTGSAAFTVTEIEPAPGYALADPAPSFTVTFGVDGTVTYSRDESQRWVAIGVGDATSCETKLTGEHANEGCPVTVTNAAFRFLKTDLDGKPLAGATFQIFGPLGPLGQTVRFIKKSGIYSYSENSGTNELVSGSDGIVTVANLPEGTYRVKETAAPQGYMKPGDGVWFDLTVDAQGQASFSSGINPDIIKAGCDDVTSSNTLPTCVAQVRNAPQLTYLPKTGGRSSIAPAIFIAAMAAGGLALYRRSGMALLRRTPSIGRR